ncbi:CBS domain-containing protein [Parablastomonas sp. CN1-191]|uniref:CBS domain-containing protein n=1 Tax=Parablastomonas sp. CN1-191 TaxID=3400908 RepID=UPI003BF7BCA5
MTIATILANRADGAVHYCPAGTSVRDAVGVLSRERIGAMPVMADGRVAGIFSERDLLHCIAREGAEVLDRTVDEVMTAPAITVTRQTPVLEALSLMTRRRVRHLPVIEAEALVGFVSIGDLVKHRMDHIQHEAETMRSYIQSA